MARIDLTPLPYRGRFGDPRPAGLPPLPPTPMPGRLGINPLKAWRYVGCFGPELMLCAAQVRVGPARRRFAAVYDRLSGRLLESHSARIELTLGRLRIIDRDVQVELDFAEGAGVETVTANRHGAGYAWTRKQGDLAAGGRLMLDGTPRTISGAVIIDDSAGYLPRHTHWRWCAGVGTAASGEQLAWNLVSGVHDSDTNSERSLWVDGVARELAPTPISADLSRAGDLIFAPEVTRAHSENHLLVRSRYRQPFGTFTGTIGGFALRAGFGVMEDHDAHW